MTAAPALQKSPKGEASDLLKSITSIIGALASASLREELKTCQCEREHVDGATGGLISQLHRMSPTVIIYPLKIAKSNGWVDFAEI